AANDKLSVHRIPREAKAWRGIPIAVKCCAAEIYAAERTGSENADGSCVVGIEIRQLSRSFGDAAGRLEAKAEVQSQCSGDAEIVLYESEGVEREVVQRCVADELLKFARGAGLEVSERVEGDDSARFVVEEARRLIAVEVNAPLQRVTAVSP